MENTVKIVLGTFFALGFYLGWKLSNFFISIEDMIEETPIGLIAIKLGISTTFGGIAVFGALWVYALIVG